MEDLAHYIHPVARAVELVGIGVIIVGIAYGFFNFARGFRQNTAYVAFRQQVGKAILLGLEILVAADIILTVTTDPTLEKVAVLGLVVLIRTFLSFSLEVELEGRWPWQGEPGGHPDDKL